MAKICPTCGGNQIGCPTCNAPPKRELPKSDVYRGKYGFKKGAIRYGLTNWEVQGIDISKWNGQMNFAVTKTKCQYVFIRFGYGNGWKDPSCETFYSGAKQHGLAVGAYWFCNIGEDPIAHADGFIDELRTKPLDIDIVIDAERTTLGMQQTLDWILAVDGRIRNNTGKVPAIYTSPLGFWNPRVARSDKWRSRNLWDANWTVRETPVIPFDWTTWVHWQWSADGNRKAAEYGSTGGDADMDLNRFNGSVAEFNARYGTNIVPIGGGVIPPQPPGTLPPYCIINIGELGIHSAPSPMQNNVIGHALNNSKWYPLEIVNGGGVDWYRIAKDAYISKNYTRYP